MLEGVFRHNEQDMITLACLGVRLGDLLAGRAGAAAPMPAACGGAAAYRLVAGAHGQWSVLSGCLRRLQAGEEAAPGQWNGLAQRDKRAGNWERAVLLWQKAAADGTGPRSNLGSPCGAGYVP